jgi:hypothetical protein
VRLAVFIRPAEQPVGHPMQASLPRPLGFHSNQGAWQRLAIAVDNPERSTHICGHLQRRKLNAGQQGHQWQLHRDVSWSGRTQDPVARPVECDSEPTFGVRPHSGDWSQGPAERLLRESGRPLRISKDAD